jgi:hypothetical protein
LKSTRFGEKNILSVLADVTAKILKWSQAEKCNYASAQPLRAVMK